MKRIITWVLVLILILTTLVGCKEDENKLSAGDLGYDLSEYLDQDGEALVKALEDEGVKLTLADTDTDYDYEDYPFQWKIYQMTDTVYGLEYEVQFEICKSEDMDEYQLQNFRKRIKFSAWPDGDEAKSIQNTVDAVIQQYEKQYGEPTALDGQDTEDILEGIPSNKSVQWHKGGFAFCGIDIVYEPQTEETSVIIYDESAAWDQIMSEYYERY